MLSHYLVLAVALFFISSTNAAAAKPRPELVPDPALSAEEVVRIQLGALARNDDPYPDAGIEITFRFASPGNREVTGPLPRFIALVKNPVYGPMLGHTSVEYGPSSTRDGRIVVPVVLTASNDKKAAYVFIVGRHDDGDCVGCWMTEGVFRIPMGSIEGGPGASGTSV